MAGTIIADYIQAAGSTLSMNVGNTLVLTANASGLTYTPTGNVNINVGSTTSLTMGNVTVTSNVTTSNLKVTTGIAIGSATPQTGGIAFPATQTLVTDVNTLDDYEEGTWTPTIGGSSSTGTGTYSIQSGTYTKVGNIVYVLANITWSAHTGTGQVTIRGYPFTSGTEIYPLAYLLYGSGYSFTGPVFQAYMNASATNSGPAQTGSSGTFASVSMPSSAGPWNYYISVVYKVA